MSMIIDSIRLQGLQDRRRKLTEEDKDVVKHKYETGLYSYNSLAKEYKVSKSLIAMTVNPERNRKVKERIKNHWKDYQQSAKEHTEAIKKTRSYKQDLYKKGLLNKKEELL